MNDLTRSFYAVALLSCITITGLGQKAAIQLVIQERNVRAEMNFLASDAMQGRGSGTQFERIAAEYIGSQFMQFGLEPAGDSGWDGKPTYVQAVPVVGRPRLQSLQFGRAGNPFGVSRDWVVVSISNGEIRGPLRTLTFDESANAGEIVFVKTNENDTLQSIQTASGKFFRQGAAAVIVTETKDIRTRWSELANRRPTLSQRGTLIVVSSDLAGVISNFAPGTEIELNARFDQPEKTSTWNAIGKITGSDPTLGSQIILISSHLDHLGVRPNAPTEDKIFNGADDDASGSVAVLELARVLATGKKPKRTVYFVCFGSEEAGGFGANYFVNNLPFPKDKLVANLEFEMIGRPDSAVKPEELWLTGFERSNLGAELARRGAKLVQDPHPEQNFFQRSDNYTLARQGIIAHTVSSYGLHKEYHQASDEVRMIDFVHMTKSINSMVTPILWLVNSNFVPTWVEGKKP
jgi:hypothetical protein